MGNPLMLAGFALNTAGAISQYNYQRAASEQQERMARLETESAIDSAEKTRDSAIEALIDAQADTMTQAKQKKSDLARQADMEIASLINVINNRGQMGTTSSFRQLLQAEYLRNIDAGRIDQEMKDRVEAFQRDKEQVVEDQSRVINNSSLNYYNAATESRLNNSLATRNMVFSIASSGVNLGMQNFQRKTMDDILSRQRASQIGMASRFVPHSSYTPHLGLNRY